MAMHYCLPGSLPEIDPDVESVDGRIGVREPGPHFVKKVQYRVVLLGGYLEEIREMTLGNNQNVPVGHRNFVEYGESKIVLNDDIG